VDGTSKHKFAGTYIWTRYVNGKLHLECEPLNKNSSAILANSPQPLPRFLHSNSYVPEHYKKGMQVTTYMRLRDQSSTENFLLKSMLENAHEMYSLGYDSLFLIKALIYLINKNSSWICITKDFTNKLTLSDFIVGNKNRFLRAARWIDKLQPVLT